MTALWPGSAAPPARRAWCVLRTPTLGSPPSVPRRLDTTASRVTLRAGTPSGGAPADGAPLPSALGAHLAWLPPQCPGWMCGWQCPACVGTALLGAESRPPGCVLRLRQTPSLCKLCPPWDFHPSGEQLGRLGGWHTPDSTSRGEGGVRPRAGGTFARVDCNRPLAACPAACLVSLVQLGSCFSRGLFLGLRASLKTWRKTLGQLLSAAGR